MVLRRAEGGNQSSVIESKVDYGKLTANKGDR